MTSTDIINYWKSTAQEDWDIAEYLLAGKKYGHALFFCHLTLEKILKGLVVSKTGTLPLPIHDLKKLALNAQIELTDIQIQQLHEMSTWNLQARYDSYKRVFYKKASKEFTDKWFQIAKETYLWIKNLY